jgi:hypothetical protein
MAGSDMRSYIAPTSEAKVWSRSSLNRSLVIGELVIWKCVLNV